MASETPFEKCALASGLLDRQQLDEARRALRAAGGPPAGGESLLEDEQLADRLVALGMLNLWQSRQLLEGRTKFRLGKYWMIDSIGRGGMGQVFKAQHEVLERVVAVKVLPRSKSTPDAVANFMREIRVLAGLDHPNLVRALDAGEDGNVYYLVTEYVPGTDLRKLVRRKHGLSMEAAAGIIAQVAAGLHHAHQRGLIHRDVKPGNVLVTPDGRAKLSDLGLAGPLAADAEEDPRFGKIAGTADYLSPDHIQDPWSPTPAWDIYSLGCTLYYAVTAKVPFPGGSTPDKVRAHCELQPLDPRLLNPALTAEFINVMFDMMAKDPAERIPTADAVMARLEPWASTPTPLRLDEDETERKPETSAGRRSYGKLVRLLSGRPAEPVDESNLKDTQPSFPEIPEVGPGQRDASSESSQTTHAFASDAEETSSVGELSGKPPVKPLPIFHPLIVLVLFPITLVGLVMLISWLAGQLQ